MTDTERRRHRAAGQALLDRVADDFAGNGGVDRTPMFGSSALRVHGKIFAFVGGDGELIVKLPAEDAGQLIAAGNGTAVTIGRNPAREWVAVEASADDDLGPWRDLVAASFDYVAQQSVR